MGQPKYRKPNARPSAREQEICSAYDKCEMCGRPETQDSRLLLAANPWGERKTGARDGLSALCGDCYKGLKLYIQSIKISAATLRTVFSFDDVHVRIGELMKAFGVGRPVPSALLASVANQRSWKSRLRELRQAPFCWKIAAVRYKGASGRIKCDYALSLEGWLPDKKQTAGSNRTTGAGG
jgi:hypothetical protein